MSDEPGKKPVETADSEGVVDAPKILAGDSSVVGAGDSSVVGAGDSSVVGADALVSGTFAETLFFSAAGRDEGAGDGSVCPMVKSTTARESKSSCVGGGGGGGGGFGYLGLSWLFMVT